MKRRQGARGGKAALTTTRAGPSITTTPQTTMMWTWRYVVCVCVQKVYNYFYLCVCLPRCGEDFFECLGVSLDPSPTSLVLSPAVHSSSSILPFFSLLCVHRAILLLSSRFLPCSSVRGLCGLSQFSFFPLSTSVYSDCFVYTVNIACLLCIWLIRL